MTGKRLRHDADTHKRLYFENLESRLALSGGALLAVAGDWTGDGSSNVGLYDAPTSDFYIQPQNAPGFSQPAVNIGQPGANLIPIAGDWDGNNTDTIGLYDPATGVFTLRNQNAAVPPAFVFALGPANALPLVGDWDGDGIDSVGTFDPATGQFLIRTSLAMAGTQTLTLAAPTLGEIGVSGDWDGNGFASVGLYDPFTGQLRLNDDINTATIDQTFMIGPAGLAQVIVGDWDSNGTDTLGLSDLNVFGLYDNLAVNNPNNVFLVAPSFAGLQSNLAAAPLGVDPVLTAAEVTQLLQRAAAASSSEDAIIAIVDRNGHIIGVRVEQGVPIADDPTLVFAIDGAVAKARTAAFFASGDGRSGSLGPLTSRTVRFISQSTITQREVESNPNIIDPNSPLRGPGFVAPIGVGGHFPPGVNYTPPVDLFAIEHTNRDSLIHPGLDGIKGTGDDLLLAGRFNVDPAFVAAGQAIDAPESYGLVSGRLRSAQSRGIATLPGGIPLYKNGVLVGGIGVFFPGTTGYASYEQGFVAGIGQTELQRTNAPRVLEAEWIAFAAAGGSSGAGAAVGTLGGIAPVAGFDLPFGRIDLVGITLEVYGPHPVRTRPISGAKALLQKGAQVGQGNPFNGADQPLAPGMGAPVALPGQIVPEGWLVLPHSAANGSISGAEVQRIVEQGIAQALRVRSAIRVQGALARPGARSSMVFAIADADGNVLGLYRMPDATVFSIDVAVAKSRNTVYYADPGALQPVDQVPGVNPGVALTNRTFRFLAEPRYPAGIEGTAPPVFSILNDPGINRLTAENLGAPLPASAYNTVLGFDAFHPGRNFRDPSNIANQNGIVFFPGSAPLYRNSTLIAGFGVSGDGVDQDDVVTFGGQRGFETPAALRADQYFFERVRLPYQKFNRNPLA